MRDCSDVTDRIESVHEPVAEDAGRPRAGPQGRGVIVWVAAVIVSVIAVSWGAGVFITASSDIGAWDRSVLRWMADHRESGLTDAMRVVTHFGSSNVVIALMGVAVGGAYLRSRYEGWLAFFAAAAVGTFVLDNLIKLLVQRPRPGFAMITEVSGWAFPSGHSAMAAALFVTVAFVASRWAARNRLIWVWIGSACGAVLVGFSRVYLGAHWTTDVMFGLALGAFWTIAMARVSGLWPPPERDRPERAK
jgi:undecaprenyl-diphosphatase